MRWFSFGVAEEEEDGAAKEGESDEEEADGAGRARRLVATTELVDGWCAAAKERASQATTAVLLKAYRAACHYGAEDDGDGAVSQEMLITSPAVFNRLMLFVLKVRGRHGGAGGASRAQGGQSLSGLGSRRGEASSTACCSTCHRALLKSFTSFSPNATLLPPCRRSTASFCGCCPSRAASP